MIDIFLTAYLRPKFTEQTIIYLSERTKTPYRVTLIDNGGNEQWYKDTNELDRLVKLRPNMGIHTAWNIAVALATEKYFITSDNDIYVLTYKPLATCNKHII